MDYIAEVEEIVSLLKTDSHEEYASKILDAIRGGCTASEILFGIEFYLSEAPKDLKPETTYRVKVLLNKINQVLTFFSRIPHPKGIQTLGGDECFP